MLVTGCAQQKVATTPQVSFVQSSPKLEILNQQIKLNTNDAQAYALSSTRQIALPSFTSLPVERRLFSSAMISRQ